MSDRRTVFWAIAFAAAIVLFPAFGPAAEVEPAALSKTERADIVRVEAYLNGIDTLESKFLQFASDGSYSQGMLYVSRPGKMLIEYDPPTPVRIVATGTSLIYHDTELNQVSYMMLSKSPAGIILREKISFFGDELMITRFGREANSLRLTLARSVDPLEGSITLVFSDDPVVLKKWIIVDAQGIETTVSLHGTRFGVELDPGLFEFRDPNFFGLDDR